MGQGDAMIFVRGNRRRVAGAVGIAVVGCLLMSPPAEARIVVKMATLVPDGSVWDKALKEMGARWQKDTGGEVTLRIYAGGVAGDEPDVVRKMRIGQLQAAALTTAGLSIIDPAFEIFGTPMFFDSYGELFHTLDVVRPALEQRLEERGFVLLNWGHGGWVHLFSKQPVREADDLRKLKLFIWSGDDSMAQVWRSNGFKPVPLAATDILTGLQTGMIEALPTTPLAALSLQWFRQTPYMQAIGLAPLVGATVVSKKTWDRISDAEKVHLQAAADAMEKALSEQVPDQDRRAVAQMAERGLTVVEIDAPALAQWQAFAEKVVAEQQETLAAPELMRQLREARDAYRGTQDGGDSH